MNINKMKIIIALFLSFFFLSCSSNRTKEAYLINQQWAEFNRHGICLDSIDYQIHQYNCTKDSSLLRYALYRLGEVKQTGVNMSDCLERKLSILRLLHEYDTVSIIINSYSDSAFGLFGKTKQILLTEISKHNYQRQYKNRHQKTDELVTYMEYCFERQYSVFADSDSAYLNKYRENPLALKAVATEVSPISLQWYIVARLFRGDNKTELERLIN